MNFGAVQPELIPGARNAVETCLAIQPGEHVTLIADRPSAGVAASLAYAIEQCGAVTEPFLLEESGSAADAESARRPSWILWNMPMREFCACSPMPGELGSRKDIVGVVERRHIRYAHMVGITPEIMQQGMRADYTLVDRLSQRLKERMKTARSLTVRTDAGTSLVAHFDESIDWVKTGGLISARYWSNLPAGEVFTTPAQVDGTFVCDGTAGDHFCGKYGDLRNTPLVLEIRGARLVKATCSRADLQEEFWSYCHTDENSDRVGELAFGTNLSLSDMIGVLLQDEKLPGIHLAFGDSYGSQTHANWSSKTHVDVLARQCNVWIDDEQVIANGRYLLERFGLAETQQA